MKALAKDSLYLSYYGLKYNLFKLVDALEPAEWIR